MYCTYQIYIWSIKRWQSDIINIVMDAIGFLSTLSGGTMTYESPFGSPKRTIWTEAHQPPRHHATMLMAVEAKSFWTNASSYSRD